MKRRLFNLLTALSLLLCVGVAALWVRSYRVGDFGEYVGTLESRSAGDLVTVRNVGVYSSHGRLALGLTRTEQAKDDPYRARYAEGRRLVWGTAYCWENMPFTPIPGSMASRSWTGVDVRDRSWNGPGQSNTSRGVAVPHALAAGVAAVLPALWLLPRWRARVRGWRARRMRRANRCPTCGYDLRGTPDRCPECGDIPARVET